MKDSQNDKNRTLQDKSKFITDILDYSIKKMVDNKTKEQLINLISKEFEKTGILESEIIERLSRIEGMLAGGNEEQKKNKGFSGKFHKPKETYLLLNYFSCNEGGIKNLTHAFNLDFIEYETLREEQLKRVEFASQVQIYAVLLLSAIIPLVQYVDYVRLNGGDGYILFLLAALVF